MGEWQKRSEDREFGAAQVAMRQAFGVFPEEADDTALPTVETVDINRVIGLIESPTIGLSVAVVDYIEYDDLETAVARMTTSSELGEPGTSVVVGHRTGFGEPFFDLDRLNVGDSITVTLRDGTELQYSVTLQKVVSPSADLSEFDDVNAASQLILVTCNPKYSIEERLIIVAKLLYGGTQ
jgi:sortase A